MTRVTPATRVRAAIVRASSPASAGVVCIFQLAATTIVTHRAESCQSGAVAGTRARRRSSVASRSSRSSARWTAERWISSRSASSARLASGVSRRASATQPDDVRLLGAAGRRRRASSIASSWRPAALTARWRFADSALRTRLSSPRSARDDLARLELEQRARSPRSGAGTSPTASAALPRHDAHGRAGAATTPAARPRRAARASSTAPRRVDDELEVRPAAGQAQRAAGEEPAAQPRRAAVVRRRRPVERCRRGLPRRPGAPRAGSASRADARRSRSDRMPVRARRPRPPGRTAGTGRWRRARPGAP